MRSATTEARREYMQREINADRRKRSGKPLTAYLSDEINALTERLHASEAKETDLASKQAEIERERGVMGEERQRLQHLIGASRALTTVHGPALKATEGELARLTADAEKLAEERAKLDIAAQTRKIREALAAYQTEAFSELGTALDKAQQASCKAEAAYLVALRFGLKLRRGSISQLQFGLDYLISGTQVSLKGELDSVNNWHRAMNADSGPTAA